MKNPMPFLRHLAIMIAVLALAGVANAADAASWAGQYRDGKFMGGRAVFQLTIEQSGSAMQVSFDAAWNDGHGAAPEASGAATVSGNTLTFKFEDSFGNSGTGTIRRAGNDIIVSIKPTHVVDPRSVQFYGDNMRLKRAKK